MNKFYPRVIGNPHGAVMIVGQNPGKQRPGEQSEIVWEGNKSADFLRDVISGFDNLILTNICNYQEVNHDRLQEGIKDIRHLVNEWHPKKIICLGVMAHEHISDMFYREKKSTPVIIEAYPHPSYILRFNKDQKKYRNEIRKAIRR